LLRKEVVPQGSRPGRLRKRGSSAKVHLRGKIASLLREEVGLNVKDQNVEGKIRSFVFAGGAPLLGKDLV
jgi:hypothetical protein